MKTLTRIAVGVWLVLTVAAGSAEAYVEPSNNPDDVYWSDQFPLPGTDGRVYAVVRDLLGNVYIGGNFRGAGDVVANGIAKWNASSSTWSALGTGTNSAVGVLAVDDSGNLYAGGGFTTAGGVPANNIAKWDGTMWSALGTGVAGGGGSSTGVSALAVDSLGNVYAGGNFTTAGGVTVNNIAKWDGTTWFALGTGIGGGYYPHVSALAVDASGDVYAGGDFATAGGTSANFIAKWDGTVWSALGSGMAGGGGSSTGVSALAVDSLGNVYAGGYFTTAGGMAAKGAAIMERLGMVGTRDGDELGCARPCNG